jgi:hypothetical protein
MRYEIVKIRLNSGKGVGSEGNVQAEASLAHHLSHGWEMVGEVNVGEDLVVYLRLRKWRWRFWRKDEPLPGRRSYAVRRR